MREGGTVGVAAGGVLVSKSNFTHDARYVIFDGHTVAV